MTPGRSFFPATNAACLRVSSDYPGRWIRPDWDGYVANVMTRKVRRRAARLFRVLVCVCVLVQPLAVPWHLVTEDHSHDHGGRFAHAAPQDHGHDHGPGHSHSDPRPDREAPNPAAAYDDADSGSHPLHPAKDHVDQLQARHLSAPAHDLEPLAAYLGLVVEFRVDRCRSHTPKDRQQSPRPPPRLAAASPRAPPATT